MRHWRQQNCIKAQDILIKAQQDAEEMYLEDGDEEEDEEGFCCSWEVSRIEAESRTLEMQSFIRECDQEFWRLMQEKEPWPKDPKMRKPSEKQRDGAVSPVLLRFFTDF